MTSYTKYGNFSVQYVFQCFVRKSSHAEDPNSIICISAVVYWHYSTYRLYCTAYWYYCTAYWYYCTAYWYYCTTSWLGVAIQKRDDAIPAENLCGDVTHNRSR